MTNYSLINNAYTLCVSGKTTDKETLARLLEIKPDSSEAFYLREAAYRASLIISNEYAHIWAVLDMQDCDAACTRCSIRGRCTASKKCVHFSDQKMIEAVGRYVRQGVDLLIVNADDFYSTDDLCRKIERIREAIKGKYRFVLTGEKPISESTKVRLHRAGVFFGHRETPVSDKTSAAEGIQAEFIYPLSLGEEELSGDGLAELLLKYIEGSIENPGIIIELKSGNAVSESRVAQIIAVLRLAGGNAVKNICVCPISSKTAISGANVTLIAPEKCCDDNETDLKTERKNIEIEATRELFSKAGYKIAAGI